MYVTCYNCNYYFIYFILKYNITQKQNCLTYGISAAEQYQRMTEDAILVCDVRGWYNNIILYKRQ